MFERPGYRIVSRTIKRGSQVSNLITSLWRAQTFAYLAYHPSWFLFGFSLCGVLVLVVVFMTSQGLSKMDFVRKLVAFSVLEVLPVVIYREVKPFPHLVLSSIVGQ